MDQKNTIVKCKAHPNCLFNHNGTCDNYVINIGANGQCECYVETEPVRGQKTCQDDCIHFDDSDPMIGPRCLFQHPEPLKEFYKDMPCDYYHKRGQRAKCNLYEDMMDIDDKHLGEPMIVKMKIAELNKPNKNKSIISDWDYAATTDICKTCKKVVYGQPCKYKNVANGVWTCYERDESIKCAGTLNECWWCDFFNSEKRSCKHKDPDIDKYGCHSSQSTGGNR